jgi:hypothetical protein
MQEVFEGLVKDTMDMYDDAVRHTDVVRLLKDLKIQRVCADARVKLLERMLNTEGVHDPVDDELLEVEALEKSGEIEAFNYVIDVIESGKFAGK